MDGIYAVLIPPQQALPERMPECVTLIARNEIGKFRADALGQLDGEGFQDTRIVPDQWIADESVDTPACGKRGCWRGSIQMRVQQIPRMTR